MANSRLLPVQADCKASSAMRTLTRPLPSVGRNVETRSVGSSSTETAKLLRLQRQAGNAAVLTALRRRGPSCSSDSAVCPEPIRCQRDLYTSFKGAVGSEHPTGSQGEQSAKADFQEKKRQLKAAGKDPKVQITGALSEILDGVLPDDLGAFDPHTFDWTGKIDLLFDNLVDYANANWDYSAGGAGRAPIYLAGVGHCGNQATAFLQTVHVLAAELAEPALGCALRGTAGFLLTANIGGAMTGRNAPHGNIAARLDQVNDPVAPNYAGVNRAHFKGHTWAEVTFPTGGTRIYDVLMGTKGVAVNPSVPAVSEFPRAHDAAGAPLPGPPGFNAGKYWVASNLHAQVVAVGATEKNLRDSGIANASDIDALKQAIANEKLRYGITRWMRPDTDLIDQCLAVQAIQALDPALVDLYYRFGLNRSSTAALFAATGTVPAADLTAVTG